MKASIFSFLLLLPSLFLIPVFPEFTVAHNLFSTHSAAPWSRGTRLWFIQQNTSVVSQQNPPNSHQYPNVGPNQNSNPNPISDGSTHISAFISHGTGYVSDRVGYSNGEDQIGQGGHLDKPDGTDFTDKTNGGDHKGRLDRGDRIIETDVGDQTVNRQDCFIDGGHCFTSGFRPLDGGNHINEMSGGDHITEIYGEEHIIHGRDHITEIYEGDHINQIINIRGDNTDRRSLLRIRSSFKDILSRYVFISTKRPSFKDVLSRYVFSSSDGSQTFRTIFLLLWLVILFYLLSTTASEYFSSSLEHISEALNLSPAVAGVTLLAIGNGAPDVFSSVAAFVSSDTSGSIGFGAVLGSALFITTIVSGSVALVTTRICKKAGSEKINLVCFVRDALFLLASASVLMVICMDAKVYLWEAVCFLCVYVVYAASVWAAEMLENRHRNNSLVLDPLVPKAMTEHVLPQWVATSPKWHYYHIHRHRQDCEVELEYLYDKHYAIYRKCKRHASFLYKYGIERPLAVPRLLTIPVIEEERWSRPLAVISCTLAPVFIGCIFLVHCNEAKVSTNKVLEISGSIGILLGAVAFCSTENAKPPQRFLWFWLAGGFFMSIVWFYIVADQLVVCLEMLGSIFHINPTILGLTVLAWGNSIGDLVADIALACSGRNGVKIVVAGCYAGPLFNTVIGLGLSLAVACWSSYPEPLMISDDDGSLFFIIGFLVAGLAWALIMIPLKGMRLSRSFGAGLVLLYCGFLATGMCYAMGWILR